MQRGIGLCELPRRMRWCASSPHSMGVELTPTASKVNERSKESASITRRERLHAAESNIRSTFGAVEIKALGHSSFERHTSPAPASDPRLISEPTSGPFADISTHMSDPKGALSFTDLMINGVRLNEGIELRVTPRECF